MLCFRISEKEPDESDEIFTDVDVSDPFFSQEIEFGLNKGDKASAKTKKNRKRAGKETEEDKKAKVNEYLLIFSVLTFIGKSLLTCAQFFARYLNCCRTFRRSLPLLFALTVLAST